MHKTVAYREGFYGILAKAGISKEAFHKFAINIDPTALINLARTHMGSSGNKLLGALPEVVRQLATNMRYSPAQIEEAITAAQRFTGKAQIPKGIAHSPMSTPGQQLGATTVARDQLRLPTTPTTTYIPNPLLPQAYTDPTITKGFSNTYESYMQGFIEKCSEYDIDPSIILNMIKR